MVYRTRTKYTAAQRAEIWDRWQRGESHSAPEHPSSAIPGQKHEDSGYPYNPVY